MQLLAWSFGQRDAQTLEVCKCLSAMVGRRKEAVKGEPVNGPRNGADVVTAHVAEMEDLGPDQWVVGMSVMSIVSRVG